MRDEDMIGSVITVLFLFFHCNSAGFVELNPSTANHSCSEEYDTESNRSSKQYLPWGGASFCSPGAVCTTLAQCVASGGTALSYCSLAYYTGVCCIKYEDCGRTASTKVAFFRNPRYPAADQGSMNCVFSLATENTTCGVRIDFLEAVFATSTDDGCYQDIVTILNLNPQFTGFNTPFCGLIQGYSTVLLVRGSSRVQVAVTLQNARGSIWNIRLTQIFCQQAVLQANFRVLAAEEDACGISNVLLERVEAASNRNVFNDRFLEDEANSTLPGQRNNLLNPYGATGKLGDAEIPGRKSKKLPFLKKSNFSGVFKAGRSRGPLQPPGQEVDVGDGGDGELLQKIVGGAQASPHQFPWLAALLLDGSLLCGGSLVNRLWVLTAAHCVMLTGSVVPAIARLQVALGVHNLSDAAADPRRVLRFASNVVRHPGYLGGNYDVSLVRLSEPVRYSSTVRPVCLPRSPDRTYDGAKGVIAGWGSTVDTRSSDVLMFAPIPILNNSFCSSAWAALGVTIQDSMVCAGLSGTATCLGDSGGPLMVKDEGGLYVIVGITSFGAPPSCGSPTYPDVWTRVSSYLSWIALALVDAA